MSSILYRINSVLSRVVVSIPIGTNLGLFYLLWMLVSGRLLQSRGAIIPGLGCDRAIPNELRRLLPRFNLRSLLLSHKHGWRSQVPLMDVLPNVTKPDHPQVQDDLSACDGPCHA